MIQFFESASKDEGSRKKAKLEEVNEETMDEAMPGYHEHDEADCEPEVEDDFDGEEIIDLTETETHVYANHTEANKPQTRRPPHSTTNAHASSSVLPSPQRQRRNSETMMAGSKAQTSPFTEQKLETHVCPICGKAMETDNQGLNAHVDFCLSRGAIMEAQGAAAKSIRDTTTFKGWPKAESTTKTKPKSPPLGKGKAGPSRTMKRKK